MIHESRRFAPTVQRYEAKYLVDETQAGEVRRWCRDHLPPDPHSALADCPQYPVVSIYLDSARRDLLQHTLARRESRFKLRVRTYRMCDEPAADRPAYFEVKRKVHGVVSKTRAIVAGESADALLWDGSAPIGRAVGIAACSGLDEFQQLRGCIRADPTVGVYYEREAYEGQSADKIRITLDRQLRYGLVAPPGPSRREMWWPADPGGVILEVKFSNTYPFWVAHMIRRIEASRRGVCKYVTCVRAAGLVGGHVSIT